MELASLLKAANHIKKGISSEVPFSISADVLLTGILSLYTSFESVFAWNLATLMMKRSCMPSPISPFSS